MTPYRPRISPRVVRDLQRRMSSDHWLGEPSIDTPPVLRNVQQWLFVVFALAWAALALAAPIILFLLLFRMNYTVQWLVAGLWLLLASGVTVSGMMIINGVVQLWHQPRRVPGQMVLGIAGLLFIGNTVLLFPGLRGRVPAYVTLGVSIVLAGLLVGWAAYLLFTRTQKPLWLRILDLVVILYYAIGLIVMNLVVGHDAIGLAPQTARGLSVLGRTMLPFNIFVIALMPLGQADLSHIRWNKTTSWLVGTLVVALLVLMLLTVFELFAG